MFGAIRYGKCEKCGAASYDMDNHVCESSVGAAMQVSELMDEFTTKNNWKPFTVWANSWRGTKGYKFECYWNEHRGEYD